MTNTATIASTWTLPADLLDTPLDGHRVAGLALRDLAATGPLLVVFLRHYG